MTFVTYLSSETLKKVRALLEENGFHHLNELGTKLNVQFNFVHAVVLYYY